MRFVIVGSMMRGAVTPHEPLDENGQRLAYWQMCEDAGRDLRVLFELDQRVIWSQTRRKAGAA